VRFVVITDYKGKVLGPQAKKAFLDHPHKEGIDLESESQCTLNQLAAALD
jgi:hypothetical protein